MMIDTLSEESKNVRTDMGFSPANQIMSPYSDGFDSCGESPLSDGGMSEIFKPMGFFDVKEDEHIHDQLPSVEEAKANIHFDAGTRLKQRNKRIDKKGWFLLFGVIILALAVSGLLARSKNSQYQIVMNTMTKTLRISHPDAFLDSESPQSKALRWMLYEDARQLTVPTEKTQPFVQRYIIAVLVFSLTTSSTKMSMTSVPSSHENTREAFGLLSRVHECEWNSDWQRVDYDDENGNPVVGTERTTLGIICGFNDEIENVDNVSNLSVTGIVFRRSGLEGELPPELEILEHLSMVDLANNQINGRIPLMTHLETLSLAYNKLSGYLPDYFSEMTRLQSLSLSENALQGSIPSQFSALTNLRILALNGNQLTGGIDEIYKLTNLEELYLAYNSFEDHLSNGSFQKLSSLRVIDAKDNRLSGPLPDALWKKLTHLEVIDFHQNALDGHIDNVIVDNHPLKYLDISKNILSGGIPSSMSNLKSLTHLDVSYNRFDAKLMPHLATMTNLKTLLLTEGEGFGPQPLPDWLRGMTDLEQLSFRLATRTGTIPTWFGELNQLELLDLDWNHIVSMIRWQQTEHIRIP